MMRTQTRCSGSPHPYESCDPKLRLTNAITRLKTAQAYMAARQSRIDRFREAISRNQLEDFPLATRSTPEGRKEKRTGRLVRSEASCLFGVLCGIYEGPFVPSIDFDDYPRIKSLLYDAVAAAQLPWFDISIVKEELDMWQNPMLGQAYWDDWAEWRRASHIEMLLKVDQVLNG